MADFEVKENINLGGNKIKNGGFEVVTSLPTTNNFVGRQVTYQGRSYIWDGSAWKCDADTLGGYSRNNYIHNGDIIQNTNSFGGRKLYINTLDNALAAADKKYFVIITIHKKNVGGINYPKPINAGNILLPQWEDSPIVSNISSQASFLFNNNYEDGISIPADSYAKIRINWNQDGTAFFSWYPYGFFYLNYYYYYTPDLGNHIRLYNGYSPQGEGYKKYDFYNFIGDTYGYHCIQQVDEGYNYGLRELEFIVFGKLCPDGVNPTLLTQIEWKLDRPFFASHSPSFTNYGSNKAYYPFRIGTNLADNITLNPDGNITAAGSITSNETINFDTNNIEPTQTGTVTKTSTWTWQYLVQSVNFLWLKLKDLFPTTQATTHNYLPKIDNANKELVKSNIQDDGTTPKYGANTIWHSGNDGSSSGLDADLLDGKHATDFATSTHDHASTYLGLTATAVDSDKLDGKHATDFAQLVNGKILEGNLPDYIFGQVLFGGSVAINTSTNKLVCTLSAKFKSKYNITENTLLLENMPASTYEGVFFIAANSWNTPPNDVQVGDWLISNGFSWSKVDNSDVVSSVNGQIGAVVLTHADVDAASSNHTHDYYGKRTVGNDGQIVRDISDPAILALMAESGEIDGTFSIEGYVDDLPIRGGCGDEMTHRPNDWWRGSFVKTFRNLNEDENTTHFFQMILGSKWLNSTSADPSIYIRAFNESMYDKEGGNENYSGWSHWRKVLTCKDLANPEFTQLNKEYEIDNPYITAGSITNIDINKGNERTYQFALPQMTTDPSEAEATPPKFLSYGESTININLEAGVTYSPVWTIPSGYIIIYEVDNVTKLNMLNNNNSNGAVFVMKIKGFPAVGNKPPYYLLKFELYLQ